MAITHLIFDADNTLYFTKEASRLGYAAMMEHLETKTGIAKDKLTSTYEKIVQEIKHDPDPTVRRREYALQRALQHYFQDTPTLVADAVQIFWDVTAKNVKPAEGVTALLPLLSRNFTLAVASDEFYRPLTHKLMAVLGTTDLFATIVTPEATHSMKPSRSYYDSVTTALQVQPDQCMMIGDSWRRDLELAAPLGIRTVLVGREREGSPDHWLRQLSELEALLVVYQK